MKVLLVSTVYPPAIGGPALQTREIAAALTRHGHAVTVLATGGSAEPSHDFELIHWPTRRRPFDRVSRNLRLLRDLAALMRRVQPDLVHMQTCEGNVPFAVGWAARAQGIARLVKLSSDAVWSKLNRDRHLGVPHGELHHSSLRARWLTRVQGATLAQYNLVWATSPFSEHSLRNIYRVPAEAIHALPNLVRLQASGRQPSQRQSKVATGELVALLVARLVPTKGVEVALQAMAQLADRALRLRIVGEGDAAYEASLRTLAKDLGVQHRVDFVGAVPPAKLQLEYESADLLVLPSWYEAFGIVLVQAMAAGLPCVASDVGGIPSVVRDGQSGLLFPIGDATALASALRQLEDTNLRERLGTQAQRDAEQFNLETRFDDLMAMYQRAIAASEK